MNFPGCIEGSVCIDGADVAYSVIGDPGLRTPIFYHHGFPGSRHEALIAAKKAAASRVSVISIDRPGLGGSDYRERTLLDWPRIVQGVADHLGISSLRVIGVSGGTPYALVTAHALKERVLNLGIVSGIADVASSPSLLKGMTWTNRFLLRSAQFAPWLAAAEIGSLALLFKVSPALGMMWILIGMPKCDGKRFKEKSSGNLVFSVFEEALRQGSKGVLQEFRLMTKPWGFDISDVQCPVFIWHGAADTYVPPSMAAYFAQKIPGSICRLEQEAGHLMVLDCIGDVIDRLVTAE